MMDESDITPAMIARARAAFDKWVAGSFLDNLWPKDEAIEILLCSIILAAHGQGADDAVSLAGDSGLPTADDVKGILK